MCGFVGFTGLREQREAILHRMADRIIHRGPDMEGYHISGGDPRTAIALGFRRLSIIDLAEGKQPMYNEDGTVVCVFNGEIYNFMDLRTELQAKGHLPAAARLFRILLSPPDGILRPSVRCGSPGCGRSLSSPW